MKSFQLFMENASEALSRVQIDEAAGDASAFKERQKSKQSAMISTAKSRSEKYRSHGVRGTDKKSRKQMAKRNRALVSAAGQLGSAALGAAKAGLSKIKSAVSKKQ